MQREGSQLPSHPMSDESTLHTATVHGLAETRECRSLRLHRRSTFPGLVWRAGRRRDDREVQMGRAGRDALMAKMSVNFERYSSCSIRS
jgi:hypothetical protein